MTPGTMVIRFDYLRQRRPTKLDIQVCRIKGVAEFRRSVRVRGAAFEDAFSSK